VSRLRLEPMSEAETRAFAERQHGEYTRQLEDFAHWSHEDARAKAERDLAKTFPDGAPGPGHTLFHLVEEGSGARVGEMWIRVQDRGLWLYHVGIDAARRGEGLGREAMALLEEEARRLGVPRIELNVFGGNEVARSLYRSLGYVEEAVVMSKPTRVEPDR
jgi:RimJ/RimL family protein N-acetyltransferase